MASAGGSRSTRRSLRISRVIGGDWRGTEAAVTESVEIAPLLSWSARRLGVVVTVLTFTACQGGSAPGGVDLPLSEVPGDHPGSPPQAGAGAAPAVPPQHATVVDGKDAVTITNALVTITYDKHSGLADFAFGATVAVKGAYASADLGAGGYVTSKSYPTHALARSEELDDASGTGLRVVLDNTAPGKPTISQIVTLYDGAPQFVLEEDLVSPTPLSSNYLGAIIVDDTGSVTAGPGIDPRVLDVPFDNDEWVRYDSRVLGDTDFSGTSYEVAAVYESASRRGLVVGSISHDFWKTGIYYEGTKAALKRMNVFGGAATPDQPSNVGSTYGKDGTHDAAKHGAMTGTTLTSPKIFVGFFADWRAGLEAFGRANAAVTPAKPWSGSAPFGWMSWGAFGLAVDATKITATSDFLKANLQTTAFGAGGPPYVNIDAGLNTDPKPLVDHIHANGQRAGTYRVPFSYFHNAADPNALAAKVGGTSSTYADIVLRDDANNPIQHNGAYVLDVTHPDTRAMMKSQMDSVVAGGFDWLKLDFMTNGAMEGRHHDPAVKTGIQAYNQAMQYLTSLLPPNIFVSLSIAPIFPGGYGHARRISCDVLGQLDDVQSPAYAHYGSTEYLLNSLTYGWWAGGTVYRFNDPDAMALYRFEGQASAISDVWARTRATASAIAGTVFLDSTDYTNAAAASRATALLGNAAVDAIARTGGSFRPLDGSTGRVTATISGSTAVASGSAASETFVRDDGTAFRIALFDFDPAQAATRTVDLARAGLSATKTYAVTDLWTGESLPAAHGTLAVALAPGEAKLLSLQEQ
jgi:alpha-galactosidase